MTTQKRRQVLVLGANGFLGRKAADAFSVRGWEVIRSGRTNSDHNFDLLNDAPSALPTSDLVLNCVAKLDVGPDLFGVNTVGAIKVLNECVRRGQRLIHLSSVGVYGKCFGPDPITEIQRFAPCTPYEISKAAADFACLEALAATLSVIVARPSTVFSEGMPNDHLARLSGAFRRSPLSLHGNGRLTYVHADDVCNALVVLAESANASGAFNLSQTISLQGFGSALDCSGRRKPSFDFDKVPQSIWGQLPGPLKAAAGLFTSETHFATDRIRGLGWEPGNLEVQLSSYASQLRMV
jgi:nucleoside-diphosphate-sugar epimerase